MFLKSKRWVLFLLAVVLVFLSGCGLISTDTHGHVHQDTFRQDVKQFIK